MLDKVALYQACKGPSRSDIQVEPWMLSRSYPVARGGTFVGRGRWSKSWVLQVHSKELCIRGVERKPREGDEKGRGLKSRIVFNRWCCEVHTNSTLPRLLT